ncbi:MAG: hypothetical protein A2735_00900 [Candidatus Yanofskybacteria bacterium RIFCSPHIGHO2_01_FULL_41_21]|uniref:Uncharacterized protein n=1 Tax=Candidatus Yanofskybacteria bacterium RIFCSPHIGHO2_01_FULL_41_21 TaxID=1802660 RepID=A0A1F8ECW6_9BACT|nr:MAG: hypothetical protein A2735_00900 [Candidatus Yanofskybacteria bacterium RIFCSPHIGHO2_01_FULL_41_21]
MGKVTVAEARHVRAERWLKERGDYYVTSESSTYDNESESKPDAFRSVIINSKLQPKKFLWWKWQGLPKFRLATLWIQYPIVGAHGKNWVLHVYGRQNMDQFVNLAKELAEDLQVDIHVRLEKEEEWQVVYLEM